jgi:hypothetical protein
MNERKAKQDPDKYKSTTWPSGFPQLLEPKPEPQKGFIQERTIYRRTLNSIEKKEHRSFYVSMDSIYCTLLINDKEEIWDVLSYEEYQREYAKMFELIKTHGKIRGRIQFSELEVFDEVKTTVPINSILFLKPNGEEIPEPDESLEPTEEERRLDDAITDYDNNSAE